MRGFTDVLTQSFPSAKEFGAQRDEAFRRFTELIERAKQTGGLRQDFVAEDLPMLLMANAGWLPPPPDLPRDSPWLVAYYCSKPSPRKPAGRSRAVRAASHVSSLRRLDNNGPRTSLRHGFPGRPASQRPLGAISERSDLDIPQEAAKSKGTHAQAESNPGW